MGGLPDPLPLGTERSEVLPRCSARISRTNAQVLDFSMLAGMPASSRAAVFVSFVVHVSVA